MDALNKQNCHIWCSENTHPLLVTVWFGSIGLCFFENGWIEWRNLCRQISHNDNRLFCTYSAWYWCERCLILTFHIFNATINLLLQTFNGHLIIRNGKVIWPLDYFLWGAVKEKYYAKKLETIQNFKANICDAI